MSPGPRGGRGGEEPPRGSGVPDIPRGTARGLFGLRPGGQVPRYRSLFASTRGRSFARRWRAADGGPSRQRPAAEESPRSGKHGVGWEPDRRESELRSRNDTARWHGEGVASEDPSGTGETADSPGASPDGRDEPFPRPSRRARSRMLPETERGLLPRPGRHVSKMTCRRPGNHGFRAGNLEDPRIAFPIQRRSPTELLGSTEWLKLARRVRRSV